MTVTLYAQPYDQAARGFYFEDADTFNMKSRTQKMIMAILSKNLKFSLLIVIMKSIAPSQMHSGSIKPITLRS